MATEDLTQQLAAATEALASEQTAHAETQRALAAKTQECATAQAQLAARLAQVADLRTQHEAEREARLFAERATAEVQRDLDTAHARVASLEAAAQAVVPTVRP